MTEASNRTEMMLGVFSAVVLAAAYGALLYLMSTCTRENQSGACGRLNSTEAWLETNVPALPWGRR